MKLQECKTVKDVQDWLRQENDPYDGTWIENALDAALKAYEIGQQSGALPVVKCNLSQAEIDAIPICGTVVKLEDNRELPCYTVGDTPPERRTKPRGDVARGLVDAALNGGEPQHIPPRLYAGFPACYLAPVPEVKEID